MVAGAKDRAEDTLDIQELEKEIAAVETDALDEEKDNVRGVYGNLDKQIKILTSQIPYPEIEKYTAASDYNEIYDIQVKKKKNQLFWNECDNLKEYFDNKRLYSGHLLYNGKEYFLMESDLKTRFLEKNSSTILVNVNDRSCDDIVKAWRFPNTKGNVLLSRNITMKNKDVQKVDVVLDKNKAGKNGAMFSTITDAFLRRVLLRNRKSSSSDPVTNMQSIIQTIQEKQNDIRSLNVNEPFITQGCAGSGKTMVLLHRLRYLLYNNDLGSEKYLFLVPSNRFKQFIKKISADFSISEKSIFPYMSYYQILCGKDKDIDKEDTDELVFDENFLATVYSKEFYIGPYKELFKELERQVNEVINYGDARSEIIMALEQENAERDFETIGRETLAKVNETIRRVSRYLSNKLENMESIPLIVEELEAAYEKNQALQDFWANDDGDIQISPDDERILTNAALNYLKGEIANEEVAVKKANIFTSQAHKKKLANLQERYATEYKAVEQSIIAEETKLRELKAANLKYIYDGVTPEDVKAMIETITSIYEDAAPKLADAKSRKEDITSFIEEKYGEGIKALNDLIDMSSSIHQKSAKCVQNLIPSYDYMLSIIKLGMTSVKAFKGADKEDEKKRENIKLFSEKTDLQVYAHLNMLLLNNCKKVLKEKFDITISKHYKHYWFINLYCQYLTRPLNGKKYGYIYIDEGQDLSKAEIELIYKINSNQYSAAGNQAVYPIMNIFGDVNQTITKHGIRNWDDIGFISDRYLLNENFRNSNQIVEFCNSRLPFKMTEIGVDMDPVVEKKSIADALGMLKEQKHAVYIVKDEYAKKDLQLELLGRKLDAGTIYTVKEVKGLEFRETIVFNRDMTDNERYIAYTRALVKLNVIDELPRHISRNEKLYVQGDEEESETQIATQI